MSTTLEATATQYNAVNKAARTFHKAESDTTAAGLTTLVGHAITLAEALTTIRVALHKAERLQDSKAKLLGATRFYDVLAGRGDLEVTRSDVAFAFAIPTTNGTPDRAALVKLLTTYMNRCQRRTNDNGDARTPTLPRWDGFRSFVTESAAYLAKHNVAKYDSDGDLIATAKVAADTAAAKRDTDAATIIATPFHVAAVDAHPNDKVAAAVDLRCQLHDVTAALAKVMDGMSDNDRTEVSKQYRAALAAAKVLATAGITPTAKV